MPREKFKDRTGQGKWSLQVGWDSHPKDLEAGTGMVRFATVAPNMPLVTSDSSTEGNGWHIYLNKDDITELQKVLRRAKRKI